MNKEIISTKNAPVAVGAYSQAVKLDNLIFTSGQLPVNPETGDMPESVADQTAQCLKNIAGILEEVGSSLDNAVKLTVFMADIDYFAEMNETYASFFPKDPPARSAFGVSGLPKNAKVEIECIALKK